MTVPAPASLFDGGGALLAGVYRHAIGDPRLPTPAWRLKEWHYLSVATPECFLALAVVQLGYVANLFAYVVDRADPARPWQCEHLSPLGRALRFAPSSLHGETCWQSRGAQVRLIGETRAGAAEGGAVGQWRAEIDLLVRRGSEKAERLQASLQMQGAEALALVHRLPSGGAAYTHKECAQPCTGTMQLRGQRREIRGLASLDWTRSQAERVTRWNWASAAMQLPDGRQLGLNLSALVYDDAAGHSRENAMWLQGRRMDLRGVRFELPAKPDREPWRIQSLSGDEVDLTFRPLGVRRQNLQVGVVASRFIQPYGLFSGHLQPQGHSAIRFVDAFGVVEDHYAKW